ncbi:MAG TPA: peptidylprolyl isomerase [Spirochaetota bacterium]|jgi:hypothetical protein|nr:MAG: Chaperone SurA [Spirochaetes bacterium ADurb.Bin133]HNZ27159.1 peptidylprolyl isomerase [Spirochaetota bacterium]HPY86899.1 peptidylprolyl isomerase [Spirochaetota bacterium]HQB61670.1 peptidylprolyl isomerase [Spirochaetota bacterium]
MKKRLIILSFILTITGALSAEIIIKTKISAKVGNEVILEPEVKKTANLYKISFDAARNILIEDSLLYLGAKIYIEEPTELEIVNQIRDDKAYYAAKTNKDAKDVSDQEFLQALLSNNVSMKTYKEYVKKQLWISKYINNEVEKLNTQFYVPTDKEIAELVDKRPDLFEEKEGAVISMIYFSFYDANGKLLKQNEKEIKIKASVKCLDSLLNGGIFEEMVKKYSDDMITANNDEKGFVGAIAFDDPRTQKSLSEEIIETLKISPEGLVKRTFETLNGIYIFKIIQKIAPKQLSREEIKIKADYFLRSEYKNNARENTRERLIKELKEKFDVTLY